MTLLFPNPCFYFRPLTGRPVVLLLLLLLPSLFRTAPKQQYWNLSTKEQQLTAHNLLPCCYCYCWIRHNPHPLKLMRPPSHPPPTKLQFPPNTTITRTQEVWGYLTNEKDIEGWLVHTLQMKFQGATSIRAQLLFVQFGEFRTTHFHLNQQQQQKNFHNTIIVRPNRSRALYDAITIAGDDVRPFLQSKSVEQLYLPCCWLLTWRLV